VELNVGNVVGNAVWECCLGEALLTDPEHNVKPAPTSTTCQREEFIRAKYLQRRYIDSASGLTSCQDDEFDAFVKTNKIMSKFFLAVKNEDLREILQAVAAGVDVDESFSYSWSLDDHYYTDSGPLPSEPLRGDETAKVDDRVALNTAVIGNDHVGVKKSSHASISLICTALHVAALNDTLLSAVLLQQAGGCLDLLVNCNDRVCEALGIRQHAAPTLAALGTGADSAATAFPDSSLSTHTHLTARDLAECLGHHEIADFLGRKMSSNDGWKYMNTPEAAYRKQGAVSSRSDDGKTRVWYPGKYLGFSDSGSRTARSNSLRSNVPPAAILSSSLVTANNIRRNSGNGATLFLEGQETITSQDSTQSGLASGTAWDSRGEGHRSSLAAVLDGSTNAHKSVGRSLSLPDGRINFAADNIPNFAEPDSPSSSKNGVSLQSTPTNVDNNQNNGHGWYPGKYIGRQRRSLGKEAL
jgi:hypothetical protein